ncbi:MAG: restriction endonuclease subunit S [Sulfuritalea sp.]|nr:restriction endonuclease subunit S [Sulfuritalea sp.]
MTVASASWNRYRFSDCLQLINGRAYGQSELLSNGDFKVVRIQNLNGGSNWYYSNFELPEEKYCQDGDLLFAWSATFGPYIWRGPKAIFHYHIWKVVPRPDILSGKFAYLLLQWVTAAIRSEAHGVAMLHFTKEAMEEYEIHLPSLKDQDRIAAHLKAQLAAVEEARQAAQAQLDDVRRLVPAILEAAFAETDDAELVRIGDVARTTSGTTPSRSRKDFWEPAKYPWVKTGEVAFSPIDSTEERISESALAECSLSLLPVGTVLIAMYGQGKTRGQSAVLEIEAATNQACFAILPNETFDPEYLQFWLRHSYQNLRAQSEARGGNQSNLNGGMLSGFEVPRMPRDRQEGIAKKIKAGLA